MKIIIDNKNYIVEFAIVGDLENSIEVNYNEDIFKNLPCELYKFSKNKIVLDKEKEKEYLNNLENEKQIEVIENEIYNINLWFIDYDEKYTEYERCKRFNLEFNEDIEELNKAAAEKQKDLNELKKQLKAIK